MSKATPPIRKYMTTTPFTVDAEVSIKDASKLMQDKDIRHLPVLSGDNLVGILSERDVTLVESLNGVDLNLLKVEDAMTRSPYRTDPDSLVSEVAAEMAEKKYGSAVVLSNRKVVGIFTTVDVCMALAELLESRLR